MKFYLLKLKVKITNSKPSLLILFFLNQDCTYILLIFWVSQKLPSLTQGSNILSNKIYNAIRNLRVLSTCYVFHQMSKQLALWATSLVSWNQLRRENAKQLKKEQRLWWMSQKLIYPCNSPLFRITASLYSVRQPKNCQLDLFQYVEAFAPTYRTWLVNSISTL